MQKTSIKTLVDRFKRLIANLLDTVKQKTSASGMEEELTEADGLLEDMISLLNGAEESKKAENLGKTKRGTKYGVKR